MAFDDKYLDQLRATVKVSEVASALGLKLTRAGREYKALSPFQKERTPSFTVADDKQFYHDFSSGKTGDIFSLVMAMRGVGFPEAVTEVERIAGLPAHQRGNGGYSAKAEAMRDKAAAKKPAAAASAGAASASKRKATIAATYDYHDAAGNLAYQVVRFDPKDFRQRRKPRLDDPPEDIRDGWVWNLAGIEHTLYRLPELLADLGQPREDQSIWFLAEGEKDVETLVNWGFAATTNSGGAKHFTAELAQHFSDAADVVILEDADKSGAERTAKVAPLLLDVGARVRALRLADHDARAKDVTDWRDLGGTADQLYEILDKLGDWQPPPYKSPFGAKTFAELTGSARPYPWRIKGLIPARENVLIMGPSRSGKTFAVLDMAMHVALGRDRYAGHVVVPGGVAYCSYEGQVGFENRLRAYVQHHGLRPEDLASFAWWTAPPALFGKTEAAAALADDIKKMSASWPRPLAAVVIDTHNSATRGSSEIKSEDISKILDCYDVITTSTGAPLWVIGHTNNEGQHRGNQQIFNRIETVVYIEKVTEHKVERRDDENRVIRRVSIEKQREGSDNERWEFVLEPVDLGADDGKDGKDRIVSMVTAEPVRANYVPDQPSAQREGPPGAWHLKKPGTVFFRAMLDAIGRHGVAPPPELVAADGKPMQLPASVRMAAWRDIAEVYRRSEPPPEDETPEAEKRRLSRIRTAMVRARDDLRDNRVICIATVGNPDGKSPTHYLWPSGRPVIGTGGLSWPVRADVKDDDETPAQREARDYF